YARGIIAPVFQLLQGVYQDGICPGASQVTDYSAHYLFLLAYPSMCFCFTRLTASTPSGTSCVIVDPAPMVASLPTLTGATSSVLLPTKTPSSMVVLDFFLPS